MLPYTPLHHLLLADVGEPLVMTSGNVSDEPIAYEDEDAVERLDGDRRPVPAPRPPDPDAHRRFRGAVARMMLRRSRGYVPGRWRCRSRRPAGARLRRGAEEHVLRRARRARVGQPSHRRSRELGDAARLRGGHRALRAAVRASSPRSSRTTCIPDYLSTTDALAREGVEHVAVQHHHAHLAACLAEHGERGPGGRRDLRRHRATAPTGRSGAASSSSAGSRLRARRGAAGRCGCPEASRRSASHGGWRARGCSGGRAAVTRPSPADLDWRPLGVRRGRSTAIAADADALRRSRPASGRLFDAVAALCGVRATVNYEGQAAAELEGRGDRASGARTRCPSSRPARSSSTRETIRAVLARPRGGAAALRAALASTTRSPLRLPTACARIAEARGLDTGRPLRRRLPEPPAARARRRR